VNADAEISRFKAHVSGASLNAAPPKQLQLSRPYLAAASLPGTTVHESQKQRWHCHLPPYLGTAQTPTVVDEHSKAVLQVVLVLGFRGSSRRCVTTSKQSAVFLAEMFPVLLRLAINVLARSEMRLFARCPERIAGARAASTGLRLLGSFTREVSRCMLVESQACGRLREDSHVSAKNTCQAYLYFMICVCIRGPCCCVIYVCDRGALQGLLLCYICV